MFKNKYVIGIGAIIIVIFIGWFYIEQLSVPKSTTTKTMAEQVENQSEINKEDTVEKESTLTREDSQGSVAVQTTLLPMESDANQLTFEIAMNTHSGDLLQYSLETQAQLSFGSTIINSGVFEWKLVNEDSHHLTGYLKWKGKIQEEDITLQIKDIDNIPSRTFTWKKQEWTELAQ